MRSRKLRIAGTRYNPITVWNGERHRARIRIRDPRQLARDRGTLHTIFSRAANFRATRGLTLKRAARGQWHVVEIGRRDLARRLLIEIEMLA